MHHFASWVKTFIISVTLLDRLTYRVGPVLRRDWYLGVTRLGPSVASAFVFVNFFIDCSVLIANSISAIFFCLLRQSVAMRYSTHTSSELCNQHVAYNSPLALNHATNHVFAISTRRLKQLCDNPSCRALSRNKPGKI